MRWMSVTKGGLYKRASMAWWFSFSGKWVISAVLDFDLDTCPK
jgi:hypothetical protein